MAKVVKVITINGDVVDNVEKRAKDENRSFSNAVETYLMKFFEEHPNT